jgi:hypothetical protein
LWTTVAAAALLSWFLSGCATTPYEFGVGSEAGGPSEVAQSEPQIERGRPNKLLDGLGHYVFSLPSKLILLNWSVDNHKISEETEAAIAQYLEENGLRNVKVRVNQYHPAGELKRLFTNQEIHAFWRYTVGALSVAAYTIFPQRLLGGDNFNPFTNTVSLYSDLRPVALHEAGHAKDFAGRSQKAAYALLRLLPLVPLYQEAHATGDAIGYERAHGNVEGEKEAYRVLYPAYGTYVGGELIQWIPAGSTGMSYAIQLGPVIPGHLIGWIRSLRVADESDSEIDLENLPGPLRASDREDVLHRAPTPGE